LGLAVLLALLCGLTGRTQSSGSNGGQGQGQGNMRPYSPRSDLSSVAFDDADPVMVARRTLALNIQRQKQMVSDTDKLLKLAKELNAEVAAQNSGTLTTDEMHKIAEIEKLARNVRERMTDAAGQPPPALPASPPIMYPNH
jgi:hypothetical protein